MMWQRRFCLIAALACLGSIAAPRAQAPDSLAALRFRYIGPVGNRLIAVAGVPRDPNVYYAGAASGGIFKTSDNGAHWDAIFDGHRLGRELDSPHPARPLAYQRERAVWRPAPVAHRAG